MTLVKLQYGNPRLQDVEIVRNSILLRDLILAGHMSSLLSIPYPSDVSTIDEVVSLINLQVDSNRLEKIKRYETHLYDEMALFLNSYGVEADAATAQGHGGITNPAGGHVGKADIQCLSSHVQTVSGDASGGFAQHGVRKRRAIGADDLEYAITVADAPFDVVKKVE